MGVARALECFAYLAASQGQAERAARLYGAAEALRQGIGAPLLPSEKRELDLGVGHGRSPLMGTAAWGEGRGWTAERAVGEALGG